MALTLTAV